MRTTRSRYFPILFNGFLCGLIGLVFGFLAQAILAWALGGFLFGSIVGLGGEWLFSRLGQRLYKRRLLLIFVFEALFTIFGIIPLYAARFGVYPIRYPISVDPSGLGVEFEDVILTTDDGIDLVGWYVPSHNGAAIITLHGFNGNRSGVIYHLAALAEYGYGVLAYDMRAHGESGGQTYSAGWEGHWGIEAGVAFLKAEGIEHIGAIGLSGGAHEIFNALPYTTDIEAIIADGVGINTREDVAPHVPTQISSIWFLMSPMYWLLDRGIELWSGVPAPAPFREILANASADKILFITGDDPFEQEIGRELYNAAGAKGELWELPETPHVGGILRNRDEYIARMTSFFDRYLN